MFLPGVRLDVTRMILPSQPASALFIFKEMLMIKQQVPAKQNTVQLRSFTYSYYAFSLLF